MSNYIRFIEMFRRETADAATGIRLLVVTFLAGVFNVALLVIINSAAHDTSYGSANFRYFGLFVVAILLFILSQKYILSKITVLTETVIDQVRTRIADKVRSCDYYKLEQIGHSDIYSKITKDTATITQTSPVIMNALQSGLMVVLSMIYVAVLSTTAFWLAMISIAISVVYFIINDREISGNMREAARREVHLFDSLTHILDGFKEIKVNQEKSESVANHLNSISSSVRESKIKALIPYANNYIYSVVFFYLLIAVIIFVLPNLIETFNDVVVKLTTAILFIVGPLSNVVNMISLLSQSNIAVENIYNLEEVLDDANDGINPNLQQIIPNHESFGKIRFDSVYFDYRDEQGTPQFRVGPIDLELKNGEVLFIVGGNGSGKSTFLKLLTALYHPRQGSIWLDNTPIQRETIQSYRELFSIIFSDFHLFDKLYGLNDIDPDRVHELLQVMELESKTSYDGERFTNLNLSTGQRKRLALLVTYLEDKQVYVFDEWAADQDPHFRTYFYNTLLPDLQKRGKTVIVVTHDDRYFATADRILKMDMGKFVPMDV
ncbi:cyclic peptide export ABC transporter [bacterium]|nr:cyclic peptide export ABC transporter [bacterium]